MRVTYSPDSGDIVATITGPVDASTARPKIEVPDGTDLDGRAVDPDSESLIWDITLDGAQSDRIAEVKREARKILSETDWYIVRQQETGASVPQDVLDHRSAVRQRSNAAESDIMALDSVDAVMTYQIDLPEPPTQ
jgi:hypothetical protein